MTPILKLLKKPPILNISREYYKISGIVGVFMGLFVSYQQAYDDRANMKLTA
jgi:hypothetical protein